MDIYPHAFDKDKKVSHDRLPFLSQESASATGTLALPSSNCFAMVTFPVAVLPLFEEDLESNLPSLLHNSLFHLRYFSRII